MTTMNSNEREERLKQIRERWSRMNMPQTVFTSHCKGDIDFLLSLLDSQASPKPVGWISCGLRQGRDDRIVDIVFENADCAKAFIDGVEPAVGPIVAATQMRDQCVKKVREMKDNYELQGVECAAAFNYDGEWKSHLKATTANEIITALESLTLDVEQKEAK